jgi:hypothetical protein
MHWILAHFIGDYLLQNDLMAREKKSNSVFCALHIFWYMMPFYFCGLTWWQLALIAGQHYAQDRTHFVAWYMENLGHRDFAKPPMAPWSIILTDNLFHIIWIYIVVSI